MMYIPRASLVTAEPVEISGASLMVVCVAGGYEVVAADSFNRLFRLTEAADQPEKVAGIDPKLSAPAHPWSKKGKAQLNLRAEKPAKRIESSEPSKTVEIVKQTAPVAVVGAGEASELRTTEAMLQAIREAPRTSAETQDRMCTLMGWPTTEKKYRDRAYQAIWAAINAGKIEKRTDPSTQLPRLYLKGAQ